MNCFCKSKRLQTARGTAAAHTAADHTVVAAAWRKDGRERRGARTRQAALGVVPVSCEADGTVVVGTVVGNQVVRDGIAVASWGGGPYNLAKPSSSSSSSADERALGAASLLLRSWATNAVWGGAGGFAASQPPRMSGRRSIVLGSAPGRLRGSMC
jgi:hypothetical protein